VITLPQRLTQPVGMLCDLFFPRQCVGCGKLGSFLCSDCCRGLPRIVTPFCPKCGRPESSGNLCHSCWGWQSNVEGIRSPFRFEGVVRKSIYALKYHNLKAISPTLCQLLVEYFEANPLPVHVLVPVPLHPRRLRERGYNQSGLLACGLGKLVGLPVSEDCLTRSKDSQPQARTVSAEDRRSNVVEAFYCRDRMLEGKQVVLVDDVCTSGATLDACAMALKHAGAVSVWGLTLAREV